jgi:hypothetical protein
MPLIRMVSKELYAICIVPWMWRLVTVTEVSSKRGEFSWCMLKCSSHTSNVCVISSAKLKVPLLVLHKAWDCMHHPILKLEHNIQLLLVSAFPAFKLSLCPECYKLSSGKWTGICSLNANISEHSCLIHLQRWVGHFMPTRLCGCKDPVPIIQKAGWAPGPVWKCAKNLTPTMILSPDRPAHSQSLYRLSYLAPSKHAQALNFLI